MLAYSLSPATWNKHAKRIDLLRALLPVTHSWFDPPFIDLASALTELARRGAAVHDHIATLNLVRKLNNLRPLRDIYPSLEFLVRGARRLARTARPPPRRIPFPFRPSLLWLHNLLDLSPEELALLAVASIFGLRGASLTRLSRDCVSLTANGFRLLDPRSKTDRTWAGTVHSWSSGAPDVVDPSHLVRQYLRALPPSSPHDPLFPTFTKSNAILGLLRRVCTQLAHLRTLRPSTIVFYDAIGEPGLRLSAFRRLLPLSSSWVSLRSFRYGGPLALLEAGRSEMEVKHCGRWAATSSAFLTYLRNETIPFECVVCGSSTHSGNRALDVLRVCPLCAKLGFDPRPPVASESSASSSHPKTSASPIGTSPCL